MNKYLESTEGSARTMEQEKIYYPADDFPIAYRISKFDRTKEQKQVWYKHTELEFFYVETGSLSIQIGNAVNKLIAGQGIFINEQEEHCLLETKKDTVIKHVYLPGAFLFEKNNCFFHDYIEPLVHNENYRYILLLEQTWQMQIITCIKELIQLCEQNIKENLATVIYEVCRLWELLHVNQKRIPLTEVENEITPSQKRIQSMLSYIQSHFSDPITLSDIAKAAHISPSEATRCFKHNLDITPVNYLIQFRLEKAKEMLQSSKLSVTDIAMKCGFESVSYFDRVFRKKYWLTPKEFRSSAGSMDYLDYLS